MKVTNVHHNLGFRAAWFGSGPHDLGITIATQKGEGFCTYKNLQQNHVPFNEIRVVGRTFGDPTDPTNKARFYTIAVATNKPGEISNGPQEIESLVCQDVLIPLGQAA